MKASPSTLGTMIPMINDAATVVFAGGKGSIGNAVGKLATGVVKGVEDTIVRSVNNRVALAQRFDTAGRSIASFSAQTNILSRSFIDESIIDEPILPNLNRSLHEWYAAQVISALHLSQMVDGQSSVQEVMTLVQTGHVGREASGRHSGWIGNLASSRFAAQECFLANYLGVAMESSVDTDGLSQALKAANARANDLSATVGKQKEEIDTLHKRPGEVKSVTAVTTADARIGPMGQLYEIKLNNPAVGKEHSITVPVFIQMQPSIVPAEVAPRFIDMNVQPSLWQRWTQMRAGELTFWKDFVLQSDLARRGKSALKDPKLASAWEDFLRTVGKKDKYLLDEMTDNVNSKQSSNLANSVMIFAEDTVAQAKADSGIDLHNPRDRHRYFRDTYTMIIVVIDPLHQRVMIYFNGLDGSIDASYADFRPRDKHFDPKDFMAALQAFSQSNVNRLR